MYGEFFDIPAPDELVFISWFEGGEVFRGGCTFRRGSGKIFYFCPGHETFPIYYDPNVRRVIGNAVRWASPSGSPYHGKGRNIAEPLSPISTKHTVDESLHRRSSVMRVTLPTRYPSSPGRSKLGSGRRGTSRPWPKPRTEDRSRPAASR